MTEATPFRCAAGGPLRVPRDDAAPHAAVLAISYQVQQKTPAGELSGDSVESGTKSFILHGADKHILLRKLEEFFQSVRSHE